MFGCDQEGCPNWSGEGNVCPCAVFDLKADEDDTPNRFWLHGEGRCGGCGFVGVLDSEGFCHDCYI